MTSPAVEGLADSLMLEHESAIGELRGQADDERTKHVTAAWGIFVGHEVAVTRVNVQVRRPPEKSIWTNPNQTAYAHSRLRSPQTPLYYGLYKREGGERMGPAAIVTESQPLILHLGPLLKQMSNHEFFAFCQLNPEWRMERTSAGDLIIMPPTGGWTGTRNFTLIGLFSQWVEADRTGLGFDSSTGFTLPNGARRSPDLAWVIRARWEALTAEEQEEFPPLCPDFVVEFCSRSDDVTTLQAKLQEYMANGAQLGWLIDPHEKKVYIYRPHAEVSCLENPLTVSGEPLLPGFTLNVQRLWS